jgi:hypothetical protein
MDQLHGQMKLTNADVAYSLWSFHMDSALEVCIMLILS